jgi:hypothetical protein
MLTYENDVLWAPTTNGPKTTFDGSLESLLMTIFVVVNYAPWLEAQPTQWLWP